MKTCFHSHFNAIFQEFLWWAIKETDMLKLYTANFSLIHLKLRSSSSFPILMDQMLFSQIQQLLKGRKIPVHDDVTLTNTDVIMSIDSYVRELLMNSLHMIMNAG